jgi:adenylate kinase
MSARRMLLLGPPGAGKGTQALRLVTQLGILRISTGEILRDAVAEGTDIGRQAGAFMDRGELVSDEVVIGVARERLSRDDAESGFVLDGFPRTTAQAEALDAMLERMGTNLECCVALVVDEDSLVTRLLERAKIEGRSDDSEDTIRTRMGVYRAQTAPLIDYYRKRGILAEVDGFGSIEDVAKRIEEALS